MIVKIHFGLVVTSSIFGILSTAGSNWESINGVHLGLWNVCVRSEKQSYCSDRETCAIICMQNLKNIYYQKMTQRLIARFDAHRQTNRQRQRVNKRNVALVATQILMILGCLGYLTSFIYFGFIHLKIKTVGHKHIGILIILSAILSMSGLVVYSKYLKITNLTSYNWSFAFGCVSTVIALINGVTLTANYIT
ncbi:uncharacterized protein LOC105849682 isoform X2 [Hydra vulgaris]|uniref:Uncharacterized protein LOC105849682 isoform X2 n=1 Tax=Hydra vulgaris TaxID=6087 RepID=A0ABM4C0U8_HYDVU